MAADYKYIIDLLLEDSRFTGELNKCTAAIRKTETRAQQLRSTFARVAGALGLTAAISQLGRFAKECVNAAARAEGIRTAFEKIDNGAMLQNLQKATRSTVDNVKLMTAAVQARNFNIALEKLPTYFRFATTRAMETGESVDYLVNSLITGLGRKSPLILDNLGISIIDINEELKKTPDFATAVGNVIEREMTRAGDAVDTAGTGIQSMAAAWTNFKESLGTLALKSGVSDVIETSSRRMKMFSAGNLSGWKKMGMYMAALWGKEDRNIMNWEKKTNEAMDAVNNMSLTAAEAEAKFHSIYSSNKWEAWYAGLLRARISDLQTGKKQTACAEEEVRTITTIRNEIKMYRDLLENTNVADEKSLRLHARKIETLEKELAAARKLTAGSVTEPDRQTVTRAGGISAADTGNLAIPLLSKPTAAGLQPQQGRELTDFQLRLLNLLNTYRAFEQVDNPVEAMAQICREFQPQTDIEEITAALMNVKSSFESFTQTLAAGADSFEEWAGNVRMGVKKLIASLLGQAIAVSISAALHGNTKFIAAAGPAAPAIIAGVSALAAGAAKTAFNSLVPSFAEGGIISGPTFGLVGEYPGAAGNPEVIAPLSKLQNLMDSREGTVRFVIEGRRLVGILNREKNYDRNVRGS